VIRSDLVSLRRAQWRAGAWHDVSLYSKLRGE
jgi:hypothetical protein